MGTRAWMWLPPDRSLAALLLLVATMNPAIAASVSLANARSDAHQLNTGLLTCVWHEQLHHRKPVPTSDSTAHPQTQVDMAAELVAMGFPEHNVAEAEALLDAKVRVASGRPSNGS